MLLLTYKLYLWNTAANRHAPRISSQALTLSHVTVTALQMSNKLWRSGRNDNEVPSKWAATPRPLLLGSVRGVWSSTQEGLHHCGYVINLCQVKKVLDLAGQKNTWEQQSVKLAEMELGGVCAEPTSRPVRSLYDAPPTSAPPTRLKKCIP